MCDLGGNGVRRFKPLPRLLTCSFLLVIAVNSQASTEANLDTVQFAKAYAYALAIDEYCFPTRTYATSSVLRAGEHYKIVYGELDASVAKAMRHLERDQSACSKAAAFVEEAMTISTFDRLRDAADAKISGEYEDAVRATVEWCAPKIEMAKSFIAESRSFNFTVLPDVLHECLSSLPIRADTETLRNDALQVVGAIEESEQRAAAKRRRSEEAAAAQRAAEEEARIKAEQDLFRPKREALQTLVDARNKQNGESLTIAQFCVYLVSPIKGPVRFTPELQKDLAVCIEGLDPKSEADALSFVIGAANKS